MSMLTDKEITKAFEYWKKFDEEIDTLIKICPEDKEMLLEQREIVKITFEVFALINRQKAEIERLEEEKLQLAEDNLELLMEICELYTCEFSAEDVADNVIRAKSEALKEFAERVETLFDEIESDLPENPLVDKTAQIFINAFQILKKEMVGGD